MFKLYCKDNIPHTPSKVGVLESITFSHTPKEAMSVGLVKACVLRKNWFCSREIEFFIEGLVKYSSPPATLIFQYFTGNIQGKMKYLLYKQYNLMAS